MRNRRITNMKNYIEAHVDQDTSLRRYNTHALGRNALTEDAKVSMRQDSAMSLKATNAWSRIAFARAVRIELKRYFRAIEMSDDIFFVTIAPAKWSLRFEQPFPDLFKPLFEITSLLNRVHSFGLLDIAYYGNMNLTGLDQSPSLSLHSHQLVWGITEQEIREIKRAYNASTPALVRGLPAFAFQKDSMTRVMEHVVYLSKAPLREYRRDRRQIDRIVLRGGARLERPAGPWKRDLRKKDAARMANLLANTTIPHLTITTGDGNELWRRIEARAIRILEQQSAEHIAHMRALLEG